MCDVVPFPLIRRRGWIAKHLAATTHYSSQGMSTYLTRRLDEHAERLRRAGVNEAVIERDVQPVFQRFVNAVADHAGAA